jgi:hypothetical protein
MRYWEAAKMIFHGHPKVVATTEGWFFARSVSRFAGRHLV